MPLMVTAHAALLWRTVDTAWGHLALVADDRQKLVAVILPMAENALLEAEIAIRYPAARAAGAYLLPQLAGQIRNYFDGRGAEFSFEPAAAKGQSAFRCRVLDACRRIRFGQRMTYGQLAAAAGSPLAARAVGQAMATNALPLVIPCHRVVGAGGEMVGFSGVGGTATKLRLLEHERRFSRKCSQTRT